MISYNIFIFKNGTDDNAHKYIQINSVNSTNNDL